MTILSDMTERFAAAGMLLLALLPLVAFGAIGR